MDAHIYEDDRSDDDQADTTQLLVRPYPQRPRRAHNQIPPRATAIIVGPAEPVVEMQLVVEVEPVVEQNDRRGSFSSGSSGYSSTRSNDRGGVDGHLLPRSTEMRAKLDSYVEQRLLAKDEVLGKYVEITVNYFFSDISLSRIYTTATVHHEFALEDIDGGCTNALRKSHPIRFLSSWRLCHLLMLTYMVMALILSPFFIVIYNIKNFSPALELIGILLFAVIASIIFATEHRMDRILIKKWPMVGMDLTVLATALWPFFAIFHGGAPTWMIMTIWPVFGHFPMHKRLYTLDRQPFAVDSGSAMCMGIVLCMGSELIYDSVIEGCAECHNITGGCSTPELIQHWGNNFWIGVSTALGFMMFLPIWWKYHSEPTVSDDVRARQSFRASALFLLFGLGFLDVLVGLQKDGSLGNDEFGPRNNTIRKYAGRHSIVAGLLNLAGGIIAILSNRFLTSFFNRVFEKTQKLKDGTVVASLLDAPPPSLGQTHWLHDDFAYMNRRSQKWYRGKVTASSLAEGKFTVHIENPSSIPVGCSFGVVNDVLMPPGGTLSPEQLVQQAIGSLFCIDWVKISFDLLNNSNPNPTEATHRLARRCKPGEIDWFISHSWRDDARRKWEVLQMEAAAFKKRNGRDPVLWFDKACIDQRIIEESLKCLPIYLMSCDTMLVLAGDTYLTRLWCVWELYVLYAVTDEAPSLIIRDLQSSDEQADATILNKLKQDLGEFQVGVNTNCYDPNEEAKLLAAIRAAPGGEAGFNRVVRELAALLYM